MLISLAYAQDAGGGGDSGLITLLPLVLIFVVFYFLLIRPQQKKMKTHRSMVEAVQRGDQVVTGGGIVGTVTKAPSEGSQIQIEIAEGVRVKVVRQTLQEVISKDKPADKGGRGSKPANDDKGPVRRRGGFGLSSLFGSKDKSGG
ncbi:MAG: preprotein translocase subunit YajC [Kiloniellales bacterium]|jgi:preprotein translocase subunit YajC